MTDLSGVALMLNSYSIYYCQNHLSSAERQHISSYYEHICKYCDIPSPLHFQLLVQVAKSSPVIVLKSFHVIIFRIASVAQENICSFYVFPDNESK